MCHILLHIAYAVNYLHTLETPRCLGVINPKEVFIPNCMILPYLFNLEDYSLDYDIKILGELASDLIREPSD